MVPKTKSKGKLYKNTFDKWLSLLYILTIKLKQKDKAMHYEELMKRLNLDKDRVKLEAKKESYKVTQIQKDEWQEMRNNGMPLTKISEKAGKPATLISAHTKRPMKSALSYQWQDLRNYGFTGAWIADQYQVSPATIARSTLDPKKRREELALWRQEWVKLREAGVPAKWIAKEYGVHISYIYKIAPTKKTTVSASQMYKADLTKELLITFEGDLVGKFIPLNRDSNAEEKDA